MFKPRIKINDGLFARLKEACAILGSVTPEELAERAIEKEVDRVLSQSGKREMSQAEVDDIADKLKGLGYLE